MMQRASATPPAKPDLDVKSSGSSCPGDEALFSLAIGELSDAARREAEEHVRSCSDCREVLSEVLRSLGGDAADGSEPETEGVRLDRYELQELIGSGGAGVVYRAFDPALERQVAVKILRPDLAGAQGEFQARLRREAKATAQLSHPNVVTAYDVGATDSGGFIVLEYFSGGTLEEWLQGNHPLEERLRVMREAGRGLAAAHKRGVVHRDFKPQNVLLSADGRVCVTDFGLARLENPGAAAFPLDRTIGDATITRGLMGTPNYMAPEVLAGSRGDELSDQFSFAVALYQAMNGRHPFRGASHVTLAELLTRMQSGLIDPEAADVPEHVRKVIKRGLAAAPADRFPSMSALLSALAKEPRKSNPKLLVGGAALILFFGIGVFVLSNGSGSQPQESKLSTESTTKAALSLPPESTARAAQAETDAKAASSVVAPAEPVSTGAPLTSGASPAGSVRPVEVPKRIKRSPRKSTVRRTPKKATAPKAEQPRFNDQLRDPF